MDDLADALSIHYLGYERWKRANEAFEAGAMPFERLLREIFEPIAATREDVEAFAAEHVRFRPGFTQFVEICRARSVPFVLASGGLDIYITSALARLGPLAEGLDVRANHAAFVPGGLALSFPSQHAPGSCGTCGSCKGAVVKELQSDGYAVVAAGDGNADRCMAGVAEDLFARGRLLDWCRREGVPCTPFDTLDVVADHVAALTRTAA
jgi:2-hydroxy-3-keto-5-methylthiopentenyl-1-phosphate phosphatase